MQQRRRYKAHQPQQIQPDGHRTGLQFAETDRQPSYRTCARIGGLQSPVQRPQRKAVRRCPAPAPMLKLSLAAHFCAGMPARSICGSRGVLRGARRKVVFGFGLRFGSWQDMGSRLSWAGVAQLVEHLICNQRVGGSNPFVSSTHTAGFRKLRFQVARSGKRWTDLVVLPAGSGSQTSHHSLKAISRTIRT